MKNKIMPLCLCVVLLFALASCRGVAEKPFNVSDFIPEAATVEEQSAGHAMYNIQNVTLQQVIEFYEVALAFVGSQQIKLDNEDEDFWDYTGTYGEKHIIKITMRASENAVHVLVSYLDELEQL